MIEVERYEIQFALPGRKEVTHAGPPGEAETQLSQCRYKLHSCVLGHEYDIVRKVFLYL
jgi:hypothetical protein